MIITAIGTERVLTKLFFIVNRQYFLFKITSINSEFWVPWLWQTGHDWKTNHFFDTTKEVSLPTTHTRRSDSLSTVKRNISSQGQQKLYPHRHLEMFHFYLRWAHDSQKSICLRFLKFFRYWYLRFSKSIIGGPLHILCFIASLLTISSEENIIGLLISTAILPHLLPNTNLQTESLF